MLEICENNSLSKYIPKCTKIALYFMFPHREHALKRATTQYEIVLYQMVIEEKNFKTKKLIKIYTKTYQIKKKNFYGDHASKPT